MKRLLIVGAGGFGREVLCWARDVEPTQSEWEIGGFLDANPVALEGFGVPLPIIGDPANFEPAKTDLFVCAIGDPATKQRVATSLAIRGAKFATLLHPSVILGADCRIGNGSILCPRVVVTTNVTLGKFVTLNLASTVGHDAVVGAFSTLSDHVDITGKVRLGEAVFAGSHSCVLPGLSVGAHALIGAGSVVARAVTADTSVFGVPAQLIRSNTAK